MTRTRAAALILSTVVLAGCGAGTKVPESKADPTTTVTPSRTPSASPSSAPAPIGWRLLTAKRSGLRFAVPRSWSTINARKFKDPEFEGRMDQFAKGLHLTRGQLGQVLKQIDVLAISATLTAATYGEVQVVPAELLADLPTRESLRAQLKAINVKPLGFRDVTTPVGKGLVAEIRKQVVPDARVVYSEGAFVKISSGVVGLTVTAWSLHRARTLLDQMLLTFKDVGGQGPVGPGSTVEG